MEGPLKNIAAAYVKALMALYQGTELLHCVPLVRIMMKFLVMAGVHGRHGPNVILLQTAERGQEFV